MSVSIERKVAAALERVLAAAGIDVETLARRLALAPADLTGLISGRDLLDLARLERVLTALGRTPSDFFASLYDGPEIDAVGEATALPAPRLLEREEIERLVGDLKGSIRTLAHLLEEREPSLPRAGGGDLTP